MQNAQYAWGIKFTLSFWEFNQVARGPVDLNFALADGSVRPHRKVLAQDPEMARVPEANLPPPNAYRVTMPPQR